MMRFVYVCVYNQTMLLLSSLSLPFIPDPRPQLCRPIPAMDAQRIPRLASKMRSAVRTGENDRNRYAPFLNLPPRIRKLLLLLRETTSLLVIGEGKA